MYLLLELGLIKRSRWFSCLMLFKRLMVLRLLWYVSLKLILEEWGMILLFWVLILMDFVYTEGYVGEGRVYDEQIFWIVLYCCVVLTRWFKVFK